jgi:Cu-Zn family superoxide dismutase
MHRVILCFGFLFLLIVARSAPCALAQESAQEGEGHPAAFADIKGTAEDSTVTGKIGFHEIEGGLKAVGHVSGVPVAGKHGIHIHENGSCEDMGNAAGSHYNPHGVAHGFLPENGLEAAHAGDMGNIEIDENGNGNLNIELLGISLNGENAVAGRAVILHEKEDDFGQPTGNAGGRIGCGIIVAADDQADK